MDVVVVTNAADKVVGVDVLVSVVLVHARLLIVVVVAITKPARHEEHGLLVLVVDHSDHVERVSGGEVGPRVLVDGAEVEHGVPKLEDDDDDRLYSVFCDLREAKDSNWGPIGFAPSVCTSHDSPGTQADVKPKAPHVKRDAKDEEIANVLTNSSWSSRAKRSYQNFGAGSNQPKFKKKNQIFSDWRKM